jgi:hypothetical protein
MRPQGCSGSATAGLGEIRAPKAELLHNSLSALLWRPFSFRHSTSIGGRARGLKQLRLPLDFVQRRDECLSGGGQCAIEQIDDASVGPHRRRFAIKPHSSPAATSSASMTAVPGNKTSLSRAIKRASTTELTRMCGAKSAPVGVRLESVMPRLDASSACAPRSNVVTRGNSSARASEGDFSFVRGCPARQAK